MTYQQLFNVLFGLGGFLGLLFVLSFVGGERLAPIITLKKTKAARGRSMFLFILLVAGIPHPEWTVAHERQHIKDAWRLFIVGYLILHLTRRGSYWIELRGFARAILAGRPEDECVDALVDAYPFGYPRGKVAADLHRMARKLA